MHPIKRLFLVGLFGFGTIAGFAHGFAHVGACHAARRDAFESHVADVCTESAQRVFEERHAAVAAPAAPTTTITIAAPATLTVGATPAAVPAAAPLAVEPAAVVAAEPTEVAAP